MEITIKNFANDGDQKLVGFMVNNEGKRFAIDKRVPFLNGKTNEQYVQEALALAQAEIDEWAFSATVVGCKWNIETNSFE